MTNYEKLLTPGCLEKMMSGEPLPKPPVLQMVGIKSVATNSTPDGNTSNRYRVFVNDGIQAQSFVMLSTPMNQLYENGDLSQYCIFQVDRFVPSKVSRDGPNDQRSILIVFALTVLAKGSEVGRQLSVSGANGSARESSASNGAEMKENIGGNSSTRYNKYQPPKQQKQDYLGDVSFDPTTHLTMPIESLSPYHNKWVIKARVTAKSPIRTWSNAKGEGKLFNFDVCDETGEIRITAFRDCVDKFFNMIEIDKVYFISKCQIKPANKQYSKLRNEYEMSCNSDTTIQECQDDVESIPKLRYDFVPIAELSEKEANSIVDVIAVCKDATDAVKITAKATGRELIKREVTLVDRSGVSISLTMWGEEAQNFDIRDNPVVALKNVQVKEYMGGKTLGSIGSTVMKINPDIPEGHQTRGWFENEGSAGNFNTLSTKNAGSGGTTEWVTFHEAKERKLGSTGDKADFFQTVGMIHNVKQANMTYKACANGDCNKKVVDNGNGTYRCDKCNADSSHFKNRLLANVFFGDWTSNRWVTLFADVAEQVLGKTGDEIAELTENMDRKGEAENYFHQIQFKPMLMKIRTKVEVYGDVPRPKNSAVSVGPVPYKEYNQLLLQNIHRCSGIATGVKSE